MSAPLYSEAALTESWVDFRARRARERANPPPARQTAPEATPTRIARQRPAPLPRPIVELPRGLAAQVLADVAERHGLTVADLIGPRRLRHIAHPRQEAMFCLRACGWTLPRIGRAIGDRDHTTVLHGIRAHQKRMAEGRA